LIIAPAADGNVIEKFYDEDKHAKLQAEGAAVPADPQENAVVFADAPSVFCSVEWHWTLLLLPPSRQGLVMPPFEQHP